MVAKCRYPGRPDGRLVTPGPGAGGTCKKASESRGTNRDPRGRLQFFQERQSGGGKEGRPSKGLHKRDAGAAFPYILLALVVHTTTTTWARAHGMCFRRGVTDVGTATTRQTLARLSCFASPQLPPSRLRRGPGAPVP